MIDSHCHPVTAHGGPLDLAGIHIELAGDAAQQAQRAAAAPSRLCHELLAVRLAQHLGCEVEELPAARDRASQDWPRYCQELLAAANLTGLVLDPGWDPTAATASAESLATLTGCAVRPIWRLEPLLDRLIEAGAGATEILSTVEQAVRDAPQQGYRGLKTIAAYRTGLAIDPAATLAEAAASLTVPAAGPVRRRGKALRDLLVRRMLGWAAELALPIQIHTGFGDCEIRLPEANPLLLEELLRTPEGQAATVVLIHGAYPWHEELAYLTVAKPNVHAELSMFNIYAPATVADRLERVLELAPAARVLCGTDGHGAPESLWFAALVIQEAWVDVRQRWARRGARAAWLEGVESAIFEENTRRLYGF